jgi:hypothetical protein
VPVRRLVRDRILKPWVRIPLPPVFARVVEESEDCRAVALAKADTFNPCNIDAASYDSTSQRMSQFFMFTSCRARSSRNISIQG